MRPEHGIFVCVGLGKSCVGNGFIVVGGVGDNLMNLLEKDS